MRKLILVALLALIPAQLPAQPPTFNGYRDPLLTVNRISATEFEVIEGRGKGPRGIWCGAAFHTAMRLGQNKGQLYIKTARGPSQTAPGHKGVVFSTTPVGNAPQSYSVSVRDVGEHMPVVMALQFCRDHVIRVFDY